MNEDNLKVGTLVHTLKLAPVNADVSGILKPYVALPEGTTITSAQAIRQCEGQEPQNIVSAYSDETGLIFT